MSLTPSVYTYMGALVSGLRQMAAMKDVIKDTHGNLSVKTPSGHVCIKPSGYPYEAISANEIVVTDMDGQILEGKLKPSVDLPHHLAIYRNHPWIKSICHTHSPYAVGHAIADENIRVCCTEQADYFGHEIRVTGRPIIDLWGEELRLDPHEKAVLLSQHGALTFGQDPLKAVNLAAALENIAQKYYIALTIRGSRPYTMHEKDVEQWHKRYNTSYGQ